MRREVSMQQHQIHNYLERYFNANESPILENGNGHLHVQLSIDLDKELMNRPFYWHYLEKIGGTPQPMKMTLITDQEKAPGDLRGELVHFGSPRLHQIFNSTKKFGGFIRLYEEIETIGNSSTPLQPWLNINVKISYQCDRKKDVIMSLGLNLINGQVVPEFFEKLSERNLTPKIPDYCFKLSPLVTPRSGLLRLEKIIRTYVEEQDDKWAIDARKRWDEDLHLLNHFYEEHEEKPESYHIEKEALKSQYEPKIIVHVINGGMFYLNQKHF